MSPITSTARSADRIEQTIQLDSPPSRVWRALTDSAEFGKWFGATLEGPFRTGATTKGDLGACGHPDLTIDLQIEKMEPEKTFSFRWHPYAIDPKADYSKEPRTLVEFTLKPAGGGTLLTVVESGFDAIPTERRAKAFEMNTKGWVGQIENIRKYLAG